MDNRRLVGEEESSEARQRLARLLFPGIFEREEGVVMSDDPDAVDRKIAQLAIHHPEIFVKNFTTARGTYANVFCITTSEQRKHESRSPLSMTMAMRKTRKGWDSNRTLPLETFEAVYEAYPPALELSLIHI